MQRSSVRLAFNLLVSALLLWAVPSQAEPLTIKQPGNHPMYGVELEPHLLLGTGAPGYADGDGFGLGLRASIPIVDNGFVASINNSVAISFGLDWVHHDGYDRGWYRGRDCVVVNGRDCLYLDDADDDINYVWIPITLQWNFWLSQHWSVMGEVGPAFSYARYEFYDDDSDLDFEPLVLYVGGRWHFSDTAALTLRLGFPTVSVGVSFLL